ncbi:hypothetical protein [Streptomyces sp. NPDC056492]|uniref:hypothetical protein n=1 Tax=unclassified Streptomyces TaxID=2593676 RepID=UPI0036CE78C2
MIAMPKEIWRSGRDFLIARYVAEHQQLLMRSDKGDGGPTRVEILFGPVSWMSLSCLTYRNLTLYGLTREEFKAAAGGMDSVEVGGVNYFGIGDGEVQGLIAAGSFVRDESGKDYWEPSEILRS